ncbi:MAG: exo-alpha-sialidase [Pirellulales bacterium]
MKSFAVASALAVCALFTSVANAEPQYSGELIFPLQDVHNHGSCIVECPNGDLLACWFHGSGERTADDVSIMGARWVKATGQWTAPFLMADTPGFPDTNCCMIIDPQQRLWLLWPTIQAHTWESALMKYQTSTDYMQPEGPPHWGLMKVLHMKPGDDFKEKVQRAYEAYLATIDVPAELQERADKFGARAYRQADDMLTRRLGWFTRAHPYILDDGTMLVGLYSDGFSFSLVALTDDGGETWRFSDPIVGHGNIQPSFARKRDGTLVTYMRDNGPPPKRVHVAESPDGGVTWGTVYDHPELPNPGAGLEVANLADGDWICIYNDTEEGRHSLAVSLSSDEGASWPITRHLELDPTHKGSYSYPSIIQAADGTLHATYSYRSANPEEHGQSIKHVHFTKEWIEAGDGG